MNEPAGNVLLAKVLLDYYDGHGANLVSASTTQTMCSYWAEFFGEESVAASTHPARMEQFIGWMEGQGFSTAYQKRILGVGKAALGMAWKRGDMAGTAACSRGC